MTSVERNSKKLDETHENAYLGSWFWLMKPRHETLSFVSLLLVVESITLYRYLYKSNVALMIRSFLALLFLTQELELKNALAFAPESTRGCRTYNIRADVALGAKPKRLATNVNGVVYVNDKV